MQNIFIELLPPWIETGLQPAFYDKESGTVLQQVSRMWAKMIELGQAFNTFSEDTADTVNDYIERFTTLYNYVHDYFDNLDVQEEINNKLDQMVQDGTLQEIIDAYLDSNITWTFDTVADMKQATNFIVGSDAQTLGFYSVNDGGGATYHITNTGTANEIDIIAVGSLKAHLIKATNVKQFGAYGDGTHDDTTAIQTAFDTLSDVYIPDGTYMVDAEVSLSVNSGNNIKLSNNATLKAITNDAERYVILDINNVNHVEISGGTIEGDRATHTGLTGEWGYGIQVKGTSSDVYLHDIYIKDTWGDGLGVTTTGNVSTERLHIDNARRNGISVICVNSFISNDDFIENTNGISPEFAVDIEPDSDSEILNSVVFNNLKSKNNAGGGISQHLIRNNTDPYNIEINDFESDGDLRGIWVNSTGILGNIVYKSPLVKNSGSYGIYIKNVDAVTNIRMENPVVDGYFATSTSPSSGISIASGASETCGNIYIIEPTVVNNLGSSTNKISIRFDEATSCTYKDVIISNPLKLDLGIRFNSLSNNVQIHDGYSIAHVDTDTAPLSLGGNPLYSYMTTSNYTQLRQTWISKNTKFPIGYKMRFLNNGDYGVKLYFESQYIYGITSEAGKIIQSTEAGAYLEIMRIGDAEWTVTAISGTWTHN